MYNINFISDYHWEISGKLTKAEYRALMRAIRTWKPEHLHVRFKEWGVTFVKVGQTTSWVNFTRDAARYVQDCVILARLAATPEEKTQQLEEAKKWVAKNGYGYRFRV